jgi:hypothetical protein
MTFTSTITSSDSEDPVDHCRGVTHRCGDAGVQSVPGGGTTSPFIPEGKLACLLSPVVVTDSAIRRLTYVGVARHDQTHDKSRQVTTSRLCRKSGLRCRLNVRS